MAERKEHGAETLEPDVAAPLTQPWEVTKKAVGTYGKIDVVTCDFWSEGERVRFVTCGRV